GKHHKSYVDNLNKKIHGTELHGKTLQDIILVTYNNGSPLPAFKNAAQESMKPNGGGESSGELLQLINRDFGYYDTFVKELRQLQQHNLALVGPGLHDAYYLDFQNYRPDYLSFFMEKLISWEAVSSRLKAATA
ncbi:hypothetical protein EJD97_002273, partial [Solanum chilense]